MIVQIINLSDLKIFRRYSDQYNLNENIHFNGLMGLEVRNIDTIAGEKLENIILNINELDYKYKNDNANTNLLMLGSLNNIRVFLKTIKLEGEESSLRNISETIQKYEAYGNKTYKIGKETFIFDSPYVMGILNITDDSFSDGGRYLKVEDAVNHAIEMLEDGADFIDIGGESTRPGSDGISVDAEIKRVIPVIEKILIGKPDALISVDTTKRQVAETALKNGAKIINDISGFNFDPEIIQVAKKYNAAYVLMHMKGRPKEMQVDPHYDDVITEVYDFLFEKTKLLEEAGLSKIFIDPGIGFGKRVEDNIEILKRLEDFKSLGYPILVGVSRKSFIGKTLNLEVDNRDNASSIVDSIAIKNGARIIRTHNVKNGVQVCKLLKQLA